jgi:5'-3' exonuclease
MISYENVSIAECEIFLAGYFQNQEAVMKFSKYNVSDCEEIFSTQEEADTRIILQSMFVNQQMVKSNSNGRIVIKSSDNDVLLLSLHFYSKMTNIDELWFQTGSITSVKDGRKFIPVHDLYNSLGAEMANILPVAHSLAGCDTTSSYFGIGKKTVYKILKQNTTKYQTLTNLASSDVDTCVEAGRLLVANLYDPKGSAKSVHRDLNKLRVKLALSKDSSLVKLPPSEAAFRQHILRVAFQVYVWTHANEAKPPPRSPLEYGWRNENKYLMSKYFEGPDFYILHFLDNRR